VWILSMMFGWEPFRIGQLFGFLVLVAGNAVFNGVIRVPCRMFALPLQGAPASAQAHIANSFGTEMSDGKFHVDQLYDADPDDLESDVNATAVQRKLTDSKQSPDSKDSSGTQSGSVQTERRDKEKERSSGIGFTSKIGWLQFGGSAKKPSTTSRAKGVAADAKLDSERDRYDIGDVSEIDATPAAGGDEFDDKAFEQQLSAQPGPPVEADGL